MQLYRVNLRRLVNSVSTLPRPITDYQPMPPEQLFRRIADAKRALGEQVMVLGHNYQRDEVIEHADFRGDSLLVLTDGVRLRLSRSRRAEFERRLTSSPRAQPDSPQIR